MCPSRLECHPGLGQMGGRFIEQGLQFKGKVARRPQSGPVGLGFGGRRIIQEQHDPLVRVVLEGGGQERLPDDGELFFVGGHQDGEGRG